MTDDLITTPESMDGETHPTHPDGTDRVSQNDLSDGDRQPDVDYESRYKAQRKSADDMSRRMKDLEAQNSQLVAALRGAQANYGANQFVPGFAHQQQQQAFQPPPFGEDYLTDQERQSLLKAEQDLDLHTLNKLNALARVRSEESATQRAQWQTMNTLGQMAQWQALKNSEMQFFQKHASMFEDENTRESIMREAMRIQADPVESVAVIRDWDQSAFLQYGSAAINKDAIKAAILQHRGLVNNAGKSALQAARSQSGTISGGQRTMGEPGSGGKSSFNPQIHLSAAERAALDLTSKKSSALPEWKKNPYKSYWDRLDRKMQDARLREGRAITQKEFDEKFNI